MSVWPHFLSLWMQSGRFSSSPHPREGLGELRWTRLGKAGMFVGDVSSVPHAQVWNRHCGSK